MVQRLAVVVAVSAWLAACQCGFEAVEECPSSGCPTTGGGGGGVTGGGGGGGGGGVTGGGGGGVTGGGGGGVTGGGGGGVTGGGGGGVPGDGGCATPFDSIAGTSSFVKPAEPSVLTQGGGAVRFSACIPGCNLDAPAMSQPITLGTAQAHPSLTPALVETSTGLAAAWRTSPDAGELTYAECGLSAGSCVDQAGWTTTTFLFSSGPAVALAAFGPRRAMVTRRASGGAVWLECAGACTVASAWQATLTGPAYADALGADLLVQDAGAGLLTRTAVFGGEHPTTPSPMLYRESTSAVPANGWANLTLERGVFPRLVADAQGLPVVFFLTSFPGGALRVTRCTQRPCVQASNWVSTGLLPGVLSFTAGEDRGRPWFLAEHSASRLVAGSEVNGAWTTNDFGRCGPTFGQAPSAPRSGALTHGAWGASGQMWLQ